VFWEKINETLSSDSEGKWEGLKSRGENGEMMGRSKILNDDSQKKKVFLKFPGRRRENPGVTGSFWE
jgi:hypothetical protein